MISPRQRGFTIVELLIVIVVIGILAALVLTSFTEAQAKSRNSARVSEAREYMKILSAYSATYGQLPFTSGRYCLGEGHIDVNANGVGDCYDMGNGANTWFTSESAAVNAEMKKISPTLPNSIRTSVNGSDGMRRAGTVGIWKSDGFPYVYYILEKPAATSCAFGTIEYQNANTIICQARIPSS